MAHIQKILLATLAILLVSAVSADEEKPLVRHVRQTATAYAHRPPSYSGSCARVKFADIECGGLTRGDNGGCDSYCHQQGYPDGWCRRTYCLCHQGQDFGNNCKLIWLGNNNFNNDHNLVFQKPVPIPAVDSWTYKG